MRKVTKISPSSDIGFVRHKLCVGAYCRVSTDGEEQISSLENQTTHYTNHIKSNPDWEFAGLYYDEGISGTHKEKRTGLLNLIRDCENGKIDLFITKSISRFARNTADCLEIVRRLTDIGVAILFEKENINTGAMDSELILSILSSLAAEESVSISQNSKWSVKRRFENGTFKLSYPPYGYDYNGETITPNAEQAPIVKRIFAEVLAGSGTRAVADGLNRDGIPSRRGTLWTAGTVRSILENEKYIGDVLLQKTYTDDCFNRRNNRGEQDQYYWRDHHEPIISREEFETAAHIVEQRGKEKNIQKGTGKYNKRYAFSGVIRCGECGSTFKRRIHSPGKPAEYIAWCCNKHIDTGGEECSMLFIRDAQIKAAFVTMMNRLWSGRNVILKPLIAELKASEENENNAKLRLIENQIQKNLEQVQVLTGLISKGYLEPALFKERNNALQTEMNRLRIKRDALQNNLKGEQSLVSEAERLYKHLNKSGITEEFSDEIFTRFTEGITVFSPAEVGFRLKCNLTLRERMER